MRCLEVFSDENATQSKANSRNSLEIKIVYPSRILEFLPFIIINGAEMLEHQEDNILLLEMSLNTQCPAVKVK